MCIVTYSKLDKYSSLEKLKKFENVKDNNFPLWGHIEIVGSCSHKCPWCYSGYHNKASEYMTINTLKNVLDKMSHMGIIQITISGGEPLEHPHFMDIVEIIDDYGFIFHLNTNGELLTQSMLRFLKSKNLKQISFNFQGSKWHDKLHKVGSFKDLKKTISNTKLENIEVVAAVVIGEYNLEDLEDIFNEASDLGVDRLRVWDVLNSPSYLGSVNIKDMFAKSENFAKTLGYNHIVSYDPLISGDIQVKCVAGSGLYTHVKVNGKMVWCPALDNTGEIADWVTDSVDELIQKYRDYNASLDFSTDCLARLK